MLETWGYDADYDYGYAGCTSDRKLKRFIMDQVRDRNWIAGWRMARGICNNSGQYMNTGQRLGYFNPRRSEEFKGKISLFKNHADAVRDVDGSRRVAMKVGRAFKSMFPNFCDAQIEILGDAFRAEMVSKDLTLKSGKSRADFEKAYGGALGTNENPDTGCYRKFLGNSCLRPSYLYSDDNYHKDNLPHHPAQAYASGDFTIYWVEEPDGKVAGRCVVLTTDPDKPRAGPLYGLSEQAMTTMGKAIEATRADDSWDIFRHSGWAGAKMLNIPYVNGGYVAPILMWSLHASLSWIVTTCRLISVVVSMLVHTVVFLRVRIIAVMIVVTVCMRTISTTLIVLVPLCVRVATTTVTACVRLITVTTTMTT